MPEWKHLTDREIDALDRRLPVLVPIGLVEAHGPHLAVSVDMDTAEYFARRLAENTGAILAPLLPYGFADEMGEYPGTIGLRPDTLMAVVRDIVERLCSHGFLNVLFINGHGANKKAVELAFWSVWERYPAAKLACWNWWTDADVSGVHHADKGETEIALAVGTVAHMDRARDFHVDKPWHALRSRHALDPESGGINGEPTAATPADGEALRDRIVATLTQKVHAIIEQETSGD